jgi:hypothetical protein
MPYIAGLWADYLITYVILPVKNDISVPNRYSQTKQPYVLECAENVKNSWQYESVGKDRGLTRAGNYSHIFGLIATLSLVSAALMIMREPKTHPQLGFIALALGSAVFTSFLLEMGIILVRISNNDVSARMFAGAIRTLLAVILSAMFLPAFLIAINESHVKGNLGAAVLGIAIGLMGRQALALVTSRAQALLTKNTVSPEQTNDLVKIDGIKADDIERLSEEGIDSVHALALTPLPRLFFNTTYGLQRLCDWQDQALLLLSVGPAAAEIFRVNLMIRGAISAQAFARRALKMPDEFWVGDVPPAPPNGGANGQENDAPHQGVAANAGNAGTAANAAHGAAGVGNGGGAPAGPAPAEGGNAPAEVGALHQAAANAGAGKAGDAAGMAGNAGAAAVADAVGGVGEAAADAGTNPNAQGAAVVGNGGGPAGGVGNGGPGRAASGDKQTKARDSESHLDELTKLLRFQNAAQAMQVLTYLANYRRIDELRVFFQSEVRKVISVEQADPNRGLFGGKAVSRGRQITAEIHEGDFKGEAIVKLRVTAVTSDSKQNPLAGTVEFFLHPTFAPDRYTVDVENGVANFEIRSWGVFTIGAVADKGSTRLELNLAYIAGADELFYNR